MKLLKNSIVVLALLVSTISFAQDRELTEEQKEQVREQLNQYYEKLSLSEEQKPQFEDITTKYALQMKALKTSTKGRFAKYREFKSIQNSKNKEMETLLSAEQYTVYKKTQKEIQQKMKEKRKNRN
ncbi:hypothetical protein [Tenacibaculum sp. UWU-22]|uniref:hypothetical protein n=1 Tax=Tenacibaculum sp. UWU-22 TaxID=3234187 RepID=UPI0034DAE4B0